MVLPLLEHASGSWTLVTWRLSFGKIPSRLLSIGNDIVMRPSRLVPARSPHLWAQTVFNAGSSERFAQFMVMVRDEGGAGPAIEFDLLLEISGGLGVWLLDVRTTMGVTI